MLENERVGHLGLGDSRGRPRVLPVTYALCEGAAWTIVDNKPKRAGTEPARIRWLRERPRAALTVDHYDDDWSMLAWVQLIGEIRQHIIENRRPRKDHVAGDAHPGAAAGAVGWRLEGET